MYDVDFKVIVNGSSGVLVGGFIGSTADSTTGRLLPTAQDIAFRHQASGVITWVAVSRDRQHYVVSPHTISSVNSARSSTEFSSGLVRWISSDCRPWRWGWSSMGMNLAPRGSKSDQLLVLRMRLI